MSLQTNLRKTKPLSFHEHLDETIRKLKTLMGHGISVKIIGQFMEVRLLSSLADASAKAVLKQTKVHGGYFSCFRCNQLGS